MSKQIFNCNKKNLYHKSSNFYKEREYERIFLITHPDFKEDPVEKLKYYKQCLDYLENLCCISPAVK